MTTLDARRKQLLDRLKELDSRLHEIEGELLSHDSTDWEELATERETDEVLEAMGTTGQSEIARIRAALGRMRDGTYGICAKCGEDISDARLDVLPETPLCKSCA